MSVYRVKKKLIFKLILLKFLFKSLMFGLWSSIFYFYCNAFLRISCEWSSMSLFYPNYQTHRAMYMFILLGILSRCSWQLHYFVIWLTKFCNNVPNIVKNIIQKDRKSNVLIKIAKNFKRIIFHNIFIINIKIHSSFTVFSYLREHYPSFGFFQKVSSRQFQYRHPNSKDFSRCKVDTNWTMTSLLSHFDPL